MKHKCELCHEYEAVVTCEICGSSVCNICCDVMENDPEDVDTWVVACTECSDKISRGEYIEF